MGLGGGIGRMDQLSCILVYALLYEYPTRYSTRN